MFLIFSWLIRFALKVDLVSIDQVKNSLTFLFSLIKKKPLKGVPDFSLTHWVYKNVISFLHRWHHGKESYVQTINTCTIEWIWPYSAKGLPTQYIKKTHALYLVYYELYKKAKIFFADDLQVSNKFWQSKSCKINFILKRGVDQR